MSGNQEPGLGLGTMLPSSAIPPIIQPSPPPPVPGIAQSLALCTLFYGVVTPIQVLLLFILSLDMPSCLFIQQIVAWPIVIWLCQRWARTGFREVWSLRPFPISLVPGLVLASFGATILLLEIAAWIPMPEFIRKLLAAQFSIGNPWMRFLAVAVAAPVAEELFFRGHVLRGYLSRYPATKAIWASALLFAVFHLNPWQAVIAFPLGLGFGWLVVRTGSVLPGMLSHAIVNFSTNFLLEPLSGALGYSPEMFKALNHYPPSMLAIGGLTATLGLFLMWLHLRPSDPTCELSSS